jgi:hypothetical protein
MVGSLRPQPKARAIVEPEMSAFRLFGRHFQPLASPDPLDTFLVHRPAGSTQQRRDPAISVAAILAGKLDDVGRQRRLVIGCRRSLTLRRSAGPVLGMPVSRRCQARSSHDPRKRGGRFVDEGPQSRPLSSTSPFLDLASRRKRPRLCAAPKQIVAGHRLAAAWRQAKCSPHMFGMQPARRPTDQR